MKKGILLLIIFFSLKVSGQNEDIDLEVFAERLFQVQDESINYEDIYESLLVFYTNKLNLNKVTPEQLASLYILNPYQINSFFDYKETYGALLSINELQAISGFDIETIKTLKPFVTVEDASVDARPFMQRVLSEENNYFLLRFTRTIERELGYSSPFPQDTLFIRDESEDITDTVVSVPNRYRGSPNKLYGRFRTSHANDFSFGFTFEKDEGERFEFTSAQSGFDFYSYHLMLENKLGFEQIVLGDYQLQIGQSIVFGAGFNSGKGAETVNAIKRNTVGVLPYTSVLETGFFRGLSLTKKAGNLKLTAFYSNLNQDGNIQSDTTVSDFDEFVNAIQSTGFHRTNNELSIKDQIKEISIGGVIEYRPNRRLSIGVSGLNTKFDTPLQRRPNNYNQFEFKGDHNYLGSAFFHYTWQNFTFFGEGAGSKSGGIAAVGGFVSSLSPSIDMTLVFRNYDRDFHSLYGNALAEGSRNINERGTYWGLSIRPDRKNSVNLYYDVFTFPWLRFGTEAPSNGNEWLIRYTHKPTRTIHLYTQVRQQLRQVTLPNENLNVLKDQIRHTYIFNVGYELKPWLNLKTKVQSSTQDQGGEFSKGFAIIQDVNFDVWQLKFHTRLALFDTDNFDNAQYVYENDVLYAFSIPAYNGQGVRSYLMVRYDPFEKISLWLRYAQFSFRDRATIGSGLSEIEGNTLSEVKMMARIKF